jgi:hypothetical protein
LLGGEFGCFGSGLRLVASWPGYTYLKVYWDGWEGRARLEGGLLGILEGHCYRACYI